MDEDVEGLLLADGSLEFTCRRPGHPGDGAWSWLEHLQAVDGAGPGGLGGLAVELNLADVLPSVVAGLGGGWFEVGLVERAYAQHDPEGFARMVARWGHSARGQNIAYSATTYLARTLGTLGREGRVAYHGGVGTGRWKYNADISWWATVPPQPRWELRTSGADVMGDDPSVDPCTTYVP